MEKIPVVLKPVISLPVSSIKILKKTKCNLKIGNLIQYRFGEILRLHYVDIKVKPWIDL